MYDNIPLRGCFSTPCKFSHEVPKSPVSAAFKAELVGLIQKLKPEKKAAMIAVMQTGLF